jgi:hypothetical protein
MANPPWLPAAPSGLGQGRLALMERQAIRENAVVTSLDQRDQIGLRGTPRSRARFVA